MSEDFDHVTEDGFRALMAQQMAETAQRVEGIADMVAAKAQEPVRAPSMAHRIAGGGPYSYQSNSSQQPGAFIKAVMLARSKDADEQREGKAILAELTKYQESWGKASLG